MPKRPPFVRHWTELEAAEQGRHPATGEARAFGANLGAAAELTRLGVRHERLPPGHRSSPPHAERDEEEMVFILEGTPDLWQDGHLYPLRPGIGIGWADRTGIAHSIINNSNTPVRYLTIGEASRYNSKVSFPHDLEAAEFFAKRGKIWSDPPKRRLGPHIGLPNEAGAPLPKGAVKKGLPANAVDWRALKPITGNTYPNDSELLSDFAHLFPKIGMARIGGGVDLLAPGRRTSWPHAEGDEEEFTFVLEGTPDVWLDGRLYRLTPGDFVGWPNGTGIAHTVMNNTDAPVRLLTAGEASRKNARVFYPFHPKHAKTLGERAWTPAKRARQGVHDGLPDAQRKARRRR
ncbi:hypothetical protein sos41_21230 [Alphaproteobacteria bacterium SO-S41]|nr:hypothetical protein sos41_21230 [Alphaproteobacteria bacterium SO-S41]